MTNNCLCVCVCYSVKVCVIVLMLILTLQYLDRRIRFVLGITENHHFLLLFVFWCCFFFSCSLSAHPVVIHLCLIKECWELYSLLSSREAGFLVRSAISVKIFHPSTLTSLSLIKLTPGC